MDVFEDILNKPKLERNDLELILEQVKVYEDHIELQLKADIDSILKSGTLPVEKGAAVAAMAVEATANFPKGIVDSLQTRIVQASPKRKDKVYDVSVIGNGDPLEIYTSRDGEVIFKKYSLLGGVEDFAGQLCESISKSTGAICAVTDRDTVIAVAGGGRRELLGKHITAELEQQIETRKVYQAAAGQSFIPVCDGSDKFVAMLAAPILSEGDLLGCVLFVGQEGSAPVGDTEFKLAQAIAAFLGKHMES